MCDTFLQFPAINLSKFPRGEENFKENVAKVLKMYRIYSRK